MPASAASRRRLTCAGAASGGALPSRAPAAPFAHDVQLGSLSGCHAPYASGSRGGGASALDCGLRPNTASARARSFIRRRRGEDRRDPLELAADRCHGRGEIGRAPGELGALECGERPAQNRRSVRRGGSHQRASDLFDLLAAPAFGLALAAPREARPGTRGQTPF
jgi:hypothetical protein